MNKKDREMIAELIAKIGELESLLSKETIAKAKRYDEAIPNIKNIGIKVKSVKPGFEEKQGQYFIDVEYEIENGRCVVIDKDGKTLSTPNFRAINALNILSDKDRKKIEDGLENIIKYSQK